MAEYHPRKVVMVGGSLAGLFTGIVFVRLGYNVTILERTPAAVLQDQGAGISLYIILSSIRESLEKLGTSGSPAADFLEQYDRTKTPTLISDSLHYLNRDGSIRLKREKSGGTSRIASWDLLYNILRANFDGGYEEGYIDAAEKREGDGIAKYLSGVRVTDLKEVGNVLKVEYESTGSHVLYQRKPGVRVRDHISLFTDDLHIADSIGRYLIPGVHGSLLPGERSANIVWFKNADEVELKRILTDSARISHTYSLGVGKMDQTTKEDQRKAARDILPPPLLELWQKIESPFIQAITDSLATKAVFMNEKVFLVGDAVGGLRPHTTAGCSQGAMNALLLKRVFEKDGKMSIEEWEKAVIGWASLAQKIGVKMGNLSQFGDHPLADNGEPSKV